MQLYDFQFESLNRMHNGCILCGKTGSGKSITALSYYYILCGGSKDFILGGKYQKMKDPLPLYIITTAAKRDTGEWIKEMTPFLISPSKEVSVYKNHTVIIDSWNNIKKYSLVTDAFFLFDEQRVVGRGAWAKTFIKIARKNKWILLSATPGDTWSDYAPVFVANGFYKNITEFNRMHVIYERYSSYPKITGYYNQGRLIYYKNQLLVDMDYIRPTELHTSDIFVEYDRQLYKSVIKSRWDIYKNEPIDTASGLCYMLRKIVNSDVNRQAALLELLDDIPKAIIFYNFDYELDILRNLSYIEGTVMAEWNGHKHEQIPKSDRWVYLVQYNAGAEGWNCTQTDTIIFYSQNYSYKMMVQASGRIDRVNTPFRDLYYFHLKSKSSIDLAISKALAQKKNFNENNWVNKK